jgi:uncharacterized protein
MKFANPAPLGLSGFALTTWMLSMVNAGWFTGASVPLVLACAFAFGGTAQFAAGLMEMPRGNTFGFVAYAATVPPGFVGWWLVMWGVFTFFMWFASLALNRAVQLVFLALWITFFLLGAADLFALPSLHQAGGYTGLVTAALAFYLAAAEVINETHGRAVLPIGAPAGRTPPLWSLPA